MNDDRTKADKAWEARQEAARYRIFNAAAAEEASSSKNRDETIVRRRHGSMPRLY